MPLPESMEEARILMAIEQALHPNVCRDLQVQIDRECVLITGFTDSYYAKQLITRAVLDAKVDRRIVNQVQVQQAESSIIN